MENDRVHNERGRLVPVRRGIQSANARQFPACRARKRGNPAPAPYDREALILAYTSRLRVMRPPKLCRGLVRNRASIPESKGFHETHLAEIRIAHPARWSPGFHGAARRSGHDAGLSPHQCSDGAAAANTSCNRRFVAGVASSGGASGSHQTNSAISRPIGSPHASQVPASTRNRTTWSFFMIWWFEKTPIWTASRSKRIPPSSSSSLRMVC